MLVIILIIRFFETLQDFMEFLIEYKDILFTN